MTANSDVVRTTCNIRFLTQSKAENELKCHERVESSVGDSGCTSSACVARLVHRLLASNSSIFFGVTMRTAGLGGSNVPMMHLSQLSTQRRYDHNWISSTRLGDNEISPNKRRAASWRLTYLTRVRRDCAGGNDRPEPSRSWLPISGLSSTITFGTNLAV
jgi:hypothetical protein